MQPRRKSNFYSDNVNNMTLAAMVIAMCTLCTLGEDTSVETSTMTQSFQNISNSSTRASSDSAHPPHDHFPITNMAVPLVMMAVGALCKQIKSSTGIPIPHTVLMFAIGFGCGMVNFLLKDSVIAKNPAWQGWSEGVIAISRIEPHFLLHLFLPILLFESAFATDWHVFSQVVIPAATLAVPGLLIGTTLTAAYLMYMRMETGDASTAWEQPRDEFAWYRAIIFGAILSATDPVAVVAILKTLGAKKHLSVTIEGESLLNDGVACVLFIALLEPVVELTHLEGTEVVRIFFYMTFGGIAWGLFTGFVATTLINLAYDRPIVEITITICVAYLTFIIGEQIKVSGVLAIVTMGLLFSSYGHFAITPSVMHDMHHMWELLAFIGNSLLFGFSGIIIAYVFAPDDLSCYGINLTSVYLYINFGILYIMLIVIRGIVMLVLYPVLRKCAPKGYAMGWKDMLVSLWGALRGAVGLALAMYLALKGKAKLQDGIRECGLMCKADPTQFGLIETCNKTCVTTMYANDVKLYQFGAHMMFSVGLLVICTLVINSLSMKPLLKLLKLTEVSKQKKAIFLQAMEQLEEACTQEIAILKQDPTLQCVNWAEVRKGRYASDRIRERSRGTMQMHFSNEVTSALVGQRRRFESMHRGDGEHQEARRRFLVAIRAAYHRQFKKAFISGKALRILIEANDFALDKDSHVEVEWEIIKKAVPFLCINTIILQIQAQLVLYSKPRIMWNFLKAGQFSSLALFTHLLTRENKLFNWMMLRMLNQGIQLACDVSSAYLSAREEAMQVLATNLGYEAELENFEETAIQDRYRAKRALVHCHRLFPAITTSVKTHRALMVTLHIQKQEIKRLHSEGALDTAESKKLVTLMDHYFMTKQHMHRYCPDLRIPSKASVLREVPWLHEVEHKKVNQVIAESTSVHYTLDEVIIESGAVLDHIYVIASGTVALVLKTGDSNKNFYFGSAGGHGSFKPEKEHSDATNQKFKPHNPSDETVRRHHETQVGNLLLGFHASPDSAVDSAVDFAAGQTIGSLSWITEPRPCPYTVRATSTSVEVYKVPLALIRRDEALQTGLWQAAGRSLAFEVVRKMGAYVYWTESSLREHISHWGVTPAHIEDKTEQPDWFTVDFEVPVVLIQGEAIRVRVKRSHQPYFDQAPDGTRYTSKGMNVGGLPLDLTDEQLEQIIMDRDLPKNKKKASPAFMLPCPPDDRISPYVDFWYVSKGAWVCTPEEAKFTVVDVVVTTPTRKAPSMHRMVQMMLGGIAPGKHASAMRAIKKWVKSTARLDSDLSDASATPLPPSLPSSAVAPESPSKRSRPRRRSNGSVVPESSIETLPEFTPQHDPITRQSSDPSVHNNSSPWKGPTSYH